MEIDYNSIQTIQCHNDSITRVINLSSNFLTSSYDNKIKLFDKTNSQCIRTFHEHSNQVSDICMLNKELFASGSHDKTIKIWNLQNEKSILTLTGHTDKVTCIKLLPNGLLLSGSNDGNIKIWNFESGECVNTLTEHSNCITSLGITAKSFFSGSSDGIKRWDINSWTSDMTIPVNDSTCLVVVDENRIAIGTKSGLIKMWDLKNNKLIRDFKSHEGGLNSVEVLDDKNLVSCSDDRTIRFWRIESGVNGYSFYAHESSVTSINILIQDEILSGSNDGTVKLWQRNNSESGRPHWL